MYFLWVGEEKISILSEHSAVHLAHNSNDALKIIRRLGIPLIISFGDNSIYLAKWISSCQDKPDGFHYRIHSENNKKRIMRIMKNGIE